MPYFSLALYVCIYVRVCACISTKATADYISAASTKNTDQHFNQYVPDEESYLLKYMLYYALLLSPIMVWSNTSFTIYI